MTTLTFTNGAVLKAASVAQITSLVDMADRFHQSEITVGPRSFDLPEGYLTFRIERSEAQTIYGGVSEEGDIST